MFDEMIENIKVDVVKLILHIQKREEAERRQTVEITRAMQENLNSINTESSSQPQVPQKTVKTTVVNTEPKVRKK